MRTLAPFAAHCWSDAEVEAARLLSTPSRCQIQREAARANALPPAPPPPWADDPALAASVLRSLIELDAAGGFIKPDPLTDPLGAPDFYTECRREGVTPEPREAREVQG